MQPTPMLAPTYMLTHADVPRSFNATRMAHWREAQREKKKWQEVFCQLILVAHVEPVPPERILVASGFLRFPVRRRRDEGNYRTPIEKALGDALQQMGTISDDTPDYWRFDHLTIDPEPGPALTEITLRFPARN
jgi:hypothetical protein